MRTALKVAVVLLPFLVALLVLRLVAGGEAERLRREVARFDPAAVLGVEEEDLIVIAPGEERARRAADHLRGFRHGLVNEYGDLLGKQGQHRRMSVVIFSNPDQLRAYAKGRIVQDPSNLHGYTDPTRGAIFVPADDVATLRHEAVHWVVGVSRSVTEPLSPWLNEGLAQLFERYDPEARPATPPGLGPEERGFVRVVVKDTINVERLVTMENYAEFVGREGHRNYLEALVLTGFLFERRPRPLLRDLIRRESRTATSYRGELFDSLYAYKDAAFQRDLRDYVADLKR